MIKGLPSHPKASGQLDIFLVSVSVPQSRQKNVVSGRLVGKAGLSVLGSFFFFLPRSRWSEDIPGIWGRRTHPHMFLQ